MTTSTSYSQPTARCSSSTATGSRSAGGLKVSSSSADGADPVDPVGPAGVRAMRPAQQVPPAVPDDDRPRVDLGDPLGPGLGAVVEPDPAAVRAGLHQGGRGRGVRPGGGAVGGRRGGPADRLGLRGHRLRQRPDDLAERAADRVGRVAGVVVAVEHGHDQAERLGGAEHQRRQPQAAADPVAAVRPADRLDRDAGLAQDGDVAAGGPLRDAELVGEPVRGDARAALHQLEGQQRPRRRARRRIVTGCLPDPEGERPETLAAGSAVDEVEQPFPAGQHRVRGEPPHALPGR